MTLDEARQVIDSVAQKLDENAKIIWGAQIYKDLQKPDRVMLVITGVKSDQILGKSMLSTTKRKNRIENELGIEFM